MKTRGFYDLNQATNYLLETIIRFAGQPIIVKLVDHGNDDNYKIGYYPLGGPYDNYKWTYSNHSEIDMEPVPLGLLSTHKSDKYKSSPFICRTPWRGWKVGLTDRNVTYLDVGGNYSQISISNLLMSKELASTITGDYPDYEEACQLTKKKKPHEYVAFSRRFAVGMEELFFKGWGVPVGKAGKEPELLEEFSFLEQVLREDLQGAAA